MRKQIRHPLLGSKKAPPGNADICPGCGSHCSKTEADRARRLFDGNRITELESLLKAANLRIEAMEHEANATRAREAAVKPAASSKSSGSKS